MACSWERLQNRLRQNCLSQNGLSLRTSPTVCMYLADASNRGRRAGQGSKRENRSSHNGTAHRARRRLRSRRAGDATSAASPLRRPCALSRPRCRCQVAPRRAPHPAEAPWPTAPSPSVCPRVPQPLLSLSCCGHIRPPPSSRTDGRESGRALRSQIASASRAAVCVRRRREHSKSPRRDAAREG